MMLYYLIIGVIAMAALVLQGYLFYIERSKLLDRIMSKSYQEYEYYQKMFKGEVDEIEKQRNEAREGSEEDEEIKKEMDLEYKKEKKFIEQADEDWAEEDVDMEKLRERIRGEG